MARFRNAETGEEVAATRLKSPKQMETRDRGWTTAGAGTWEVVSMVVGMRPLVVEDPDFRRDYEPVDVAGERALEAPNPADLALQQPRHDAPAPPRHESRQALPAQPTARDYASEHREATNEQPEKVDPVTGKPLSETAAIDPATGRPVGEAPADAADASGNGDAGAGAGPDGEPEDLSVAAAPPPKPPTPPKKKGGKKKGGKGGKKKR